MSYTCKGINIRLIVNFIVIMMSYIYSIWAKFNNQQQNLSSILEGNAFYIIGLIDFATFNTIPDIDTSNNNFYIGDYELKLPVGIYEIADIKKTINQLMSDQEGKGWKTVRNIPFLNRILPLNWLKSEISK